MFFGLRLFWVFVLDERKICRRGVVGVMDVIFLDSMVVGG